MGERAISTERERRSKEMRDAIETCDTSRERRLRERSTHSDRERHVRER